MNKITEKYLEFPNAIVISHNNIKMENWNQGLLEIEFANNFGENYLATPSCFYLKESNDDGTINAEYIASMGFEVETINNDNEVKSVNNYLVGKTLMTTSKNDDNIADSYLELEKYAKKNNINTTGGFYHILLNDKKGGITTDVHIKVEEDGNND